MMFTLINCGTNHISDSKDNYLVKQHDFTFDGIISDNVHVMAKQMQWHSLGYNYEGETQALIYDSILIVMKCRTIPNQCSIHTGKEKSNNIPLGCDTWSFGWR